MDEAERIRSLERDVENKKEERDSLNESANGWRIERESLNAEVKKTIAEANEYREERDEYNWKVKDAKERGDYSEVRANAELAQAAHDMMKSLYDRADSLRKDADDAHNNFIECKEDADIAHKEFLELIQIAKESKKEVEKPKKTESVKTKDDTRRYHWF